MSNNNSGIHILFLTKWYPNKSDPQLGVFIQKHARAVSLYCKVSVLYVTGSEENGSEFIINEEKDFLEITCYYKKSGIWIVDAPRYLNTFGKGIKIIRSKNGNPQLVHANPTLRSGLYAWYFRIKYRIPYIITEHWTGYADGRYANKNFLWKLLAKKSIQNAYAVTVVSDSLKRTMIQNNLSGNYRIIPNVVDSATQTSNEGFSQPIPSLPRNLKPQTSDLTALTVSDLYDKNKNISATIRVVKRIAEKHLNFQFHIIGDGPDKEMLIDLARELNVLDKHVFFHGRQDNKYVYKFFPQIDFYICNSNVETFSVATAESLAHGKPVIATRSGGPEEFVTAETGMLIQKNNDSELNSAIIKMIETYKDYHPEKLRASVESKFSSLVVGKMFYDLYCEALKNAR